MSTLVCVPITVRDGESALADAAEARSAGADLVEFRVDEFFHGGSGDREPFEVREVVRVVSESPLPCIVTCRLVAEGGAYDGDEAARVALFERLGTAFGKGEHPPRYIDIEWAAYGRSANVRQKINLAVEHPEQVRDLRTSLILSLHDFEGRPPDLTRRLLGLRRERAARVHKIAYRARSLRDNLELFDLLEHRDRPTIALGMGEFGLMSRVLAPKFGGFLTFASLRPAAATAPGQPTVRDLLELYRFRSIGPATAVYGVIGWPVSHSLSPLVHNAGFGAVGHDGVYLPLPVAGARASLTERDAPQHPENAPGDLEDSYLSLKATLLELLEHRRLNLRGVSCTIPHKENLVRLARERGWDIDPVAAAIGAANTLAAERDASGALASARVSNTDVPAVADVLRASLGSLAGMTIAIVGAGGVARAAAYACASQGAAVEVYNRNHDRALALAEDLAGLPGAVRGEPLAALPATRAAAIVNATPVGMAGGLAPRDSAVPEELLRSRATGSLVVMDTVYTPAVTPLLRRAGELGHHTLDGVAMFTAQAGAQFRGWTGHDPPPGLFDRLVRRHAMNRA